MPSRSPIIVSNRGPGYSTDSSKRSYCLASSLPQTLFDLCLDSQRTFNYRAVSNLLPLVKSPEVILPDLEEYYRHCQQWELEHANEIPRGIDYFSPFNCFQQAIIRSIFCGNTEMALALLDFVEFKRLEFLNPRVKPLYDALRRDPEALMTLINTGKER